MHSAPHGTDYYKYIFRDRTGYVIAPWLDGAANDWVYVRHSSSVPPWVDGAVFVTRGSTERTQRNTESGLCVAPCDLCASWWHVRRRYGKTDDLTVRLR